MSFQYHESHKHRLAKELLYSWLYNAEHETGFCPELPFAWRNGNYGVHMELPFHQTSDAFYFENSGGLLQKDGWLNFSASEVRSMKSIGQLFDPSFDRGPILFVPDICIFHKGTAAIIIEVVHKSDLTDIKLKKIFKFFDGSHIEIYKINADHILSQTNIHCNLKFERCYNPSRIVI